MCWLLPIGFDLQEQNTTEGLTSSIPTSVLVPLLQQFQIQSLQKFAAYFATALATAPSNKQVRL